MKMKNKKLQQIAAKKKHKEALKKERRKQPTLQRIANTQRVKPTILIVCEGENTEPSYFRHFKLSSAIIESVGEGYNTLSLVKRAVQLAKEKEYDQVWCVFDADPKPDNPNQARNFNQAVKLAEKNNFGIAYSNQAFEYWIILHFNDHNGGKMERSDYNDKINTYLKPFGLIYDGEGSKTITEEIFEVLDDVDERTKNHRKQLAIKRAKKIYKSLSHANPAKEESSTTVFRLVEELQKYI